MRLSLLVCCLVGCGSSMQGTWSGSVTINDGRIPKTVSGALEVRPGPSLGFSFKGKSDGKDFTCAPGTLTGMATNTGAALAPGGTCTLTSVPDDGCKNELTLSEGQLTLAGQMLSGSGTGRMNARCTGAGSAVSDFGFTLSATRAE